MLYSIKVFRDRTHLPGWRTALFLAGSWLTAGTQATAQEIPRLTGNIEIDLPNGGLKSDVCLSGVKLRGDTLTLVLNAHLTIEGVSGVRPTPVTVVEEPGGTAKRYTYAGAAPRPGATDAAVSDVCVTYAGTFPVYETRTGEYRAEDASSVVAFNGRTMRARGVTRWHPTAFDPATNLTAEALEFDIEVDCPACAMLFVNGGTPMPGPSARFTSDGVRELLLVAGDFAVSEAAGIAFVGESLPGESGEAFAQRVHDIRDFLEEFTNVPYGSAPDIVSLTPVRAPREGQLWGFYSDPGLVLIGMTVPEIENALAQPRSRQTVLGFLAHEMAHRYFGWTLGAGSPQRDFFGEPFAVYFELKAIRHFLGEGAYQQGVARLRRQASRGEWVTALDEATADDFAEAGYRYTYSPAMLLALEEMIGESAMRDAITFMLKAPLVQRFHADFEFLADAVRAAGVSSELWETWKADCLRPRSGSCPMVR